MKILVTGVHGFVGSNIIGAFKDIHQLYGVDIISPARDGLIKTFSWDELDEIPSVDAVIHLAGLAHDTKKKALDEAYFKINTGLTQKIYDWFLMSDASRFIFFSSIKAAADIAGNDPLAENIVPHPSGPYGVSKIKAEEYICARWDVEGKTTYIFRPCMIHGPGNKGNLNLLYSVVNKGFPWPLAAFENLRSFTGIDNLTFIIRCLLESNASTGIYNISDDMPLSTNQLIGVMCEAMGKRPKMWRLPKCLIKGIARFGDFSHLPLNSERLRKLTESYIVDNSKIKSAIAVDSLPVSAEEGIIRTVKSFVNR